MSQSASELTSTLMTRRGIIRFLLGFSILSTVGGIVIPVISYLFPKSVKASYAGPTEVGKLEDFPVGSGKVVAVNDKPVIVVNTKAGGLKAFSAICTHLGCIVIWDAKKSIIHSPCHDGFFNPTNGAVVSGPPPRPLPAYELAVKEGKVLIGKPLGQLYGA